MQTKPFKTVDEYFSTLPRESKEIMQKVRDAIGQAAPKAEEVISYNMPAFRLQGYLVAYAAHKEHIGFYPTPSGIEAFKTDIAKYQWAKGSVQFPLDKPMPIALIKKIVKYRVGENQATALTKATAVKKRKEKKKMSPMRKTTK
ncbi:MAG TPA: DUF1801 domain-containing protein [Saprospiraceae bacterium]|nr:DUF1801 domain-containing protein [Saprospiraceae bacterium]